MKSTYKKYSTLLHTNQEENLIRVHLILDEGLNDVLCRASEKYRISKSQLASEILREHFIQGKEFSEERLSKISIRKPGIKRLQNVKVSKNGKSSDRIIYSTNRKNQENTS